MAAHVSDVEAWRDLLKWRPVIASRRVWGPVREYAAALAGSARCAQSVCIAPSLDPFILAAAMECIPTGVLPRRTDTAQTLAERLGISVYLDDAHPLRGGNGKRKRGQSHRVKLNASTYSAPRRKSWSVVVKAEHMDGDGDPVVALYNYNAYGRTAEDVRCAPMPMPVFDLGVQLWLAALPFLCDESRSAPPTHCQLLFYHCLFNGYMGECAHEGCILSSPHVCSWRCTRRCAVSAGRHHDNYTIKYTRARMEGLAGPEGSTSAGQENSQRIGSEVLLYTEGNTPMDFALSFPPLDDQGCDIANYITRQAFTICVGKGTLVIFKACDDEFFCHEAHFSRSSVRDNPSGHRLCFVFRWLTVAKLFHTAPTCAYKAPWGRSSE